MRAISVRRTNARTSREETGTYQVRIPAGVQAGQTLRVSGKGGEGMNGGSAGDIYLRVRYAQHPCLVLCRCALARRSTRSNFACPVHVFSERHEQVMHPQFWQHPSK